MSYNIDSKERIARSNIYIIFGKFIRCQIHNNDDGEILLKKQDYPSLSKNMKIN